VGDYNGSGYGEPLKGKILGLSADTMSFFEFSIRKWEDCKVQWRSFKGFLRRITRKTAR
jgi:hypothetical protein